MSVIPLEYYAPVFGLFLLLLLVVFVPRERYKELFWFGLVWGFLFSTAVTFLFSEVFHLFHYEKVKPFILFGAPLWLTFAWIPAVMLYLYFLPDGGEWYVFPLYLLGFAVAGMEIDGVLNQGGLLVYDRWAPFCRFILSLAWFSLVALHYRHCRVRGRKIPPASP